MNWIVKGPCPGCGQEIDFDTSKTTATCPRCGDITLTGDAGKVPEIVEREVADFQRRLSKLFKKR